MVDQKHRHWEKDQGNLLAACKNCYTDSINTYSSISTELDGISPLTTLETLTEIRQTNYGATILTSFKIITFLKCVSQ